MKAGENSSATSSEPKSKGPKQDGASPKQAEDSSRAFGEGGDTSDDFRQRMAATGHTLQQDITALSQTLNDAAQDVSTALREQVKSRPYATLGVAAGIGYILGGGLTMRVGALLLGTGGRMVTNMLLREVLAAQRPQ